MLMNFYVKAMSNKYVIIIVCKTMLADNRMVKIF